MNSTFVLTQGAGHKLETAIKRNDGDTNDVEWLSTEENFTAVSMLVRGKAKLVLIDQSGETIKPVIPAIPAGSKWVIDSEGTIYFEVTSNGRTNEQWITYFEKEKKDAKGQPYRVSDWGKNVLRRATDAPTTGVTYNIAVRPGNKIKNKDRYTKTIRKDAEVRGWKTPHWEVGPLIRDLLTDAELEELGLWYIVAMHDAINDSDGDPSVLCAGRDDDGRCLDAFYGGPGFSWYGNGGFAFVLPQEPSTSVSQT
ncbi:MAG TPA: hypothetical protein VJH55_00715 [Candidatus Paceibacterota bacterium]